MKLSKETLKRIIKEELEAAQNESLGMGATPYQLGYDAGYVNMPASIEMVENEEYMRGYNDGLAAGGHPPLSEGYRGMMYKRNPSLRPRYKGTGGPNPDYPPKPEDPEHTLKAMLDVLMMSPAGIRTDDFMRLREMAIEKGMSPQEAEQRIQPRR